MIFPGDAIIKTAIELGLEDMRNNLWLIDDMLSDFVNNPYLADKYGQKHIDACKAWFTNNEVNVIMGQTNDREQLPCISINVNPSSEKEDMKHMGDASTESVRLLPNQIGKPIPYVVKPPLNFTSYDSSTGELTPTDPTIDLSSVAPGMILVDTSGNGYVINDLSGSGIIIATGVNFLVRGVSYGIVPQYQFYTARVEHIFEQESYSICATTHGDQNSALWLHAIAKYCICRYKESLIEACGFSQTTLSNSGLYANPQLSSDGGEIAWSRDITMTGMVEQTFLKAPRRTIESIALKDTSANPWVTGIKISSNENTPSQINPQQESWVTIEEDI